MRFVVPSLLTSPVAIGLAAISIILAAHLDPRDVDTHHNDSPLDQCDGRQGVPQPADLTSLIQSMNIHLNRLGAQETRTSDKNAATPSEDAKPNQSNMSASMLSGQIVHAVHTMGLASLDHWTQLRNTAETMSTNKLFLAGASAIAVVFIIFLVGCTCLTAISMIYNGKAGVDGYGPMGSMDSESTMAPLRACLWGRSVNLQQSSGGRMGENFSRSSPPRPILPQGSMTPEMAYSTHSVQTVPLPPLCPTLVMAKSEARFGIPMREIAELTKEGYGVLTVVGLSTNPLLRAVVKKVGSSRTLEISMPEQTSVPRATLKCDPPGGASRSRSLAIYDMRGRLYGALEMQSTGACYVVKDGRQVLYIDGQAESLHLVLKSCDGARLGDVRCSSEPFGGVDHVEIRIEPGIDTVLVLAVVLAVLLLSPYLPAKSSM